MTKGLAHCRAIIMEKTRVKKIFRALLWIISVLLVLGVVLPNVVFRYLSDHTDYFEKHILSRMGDPAPPLIDVVMVNDELYFVLEEESRLKHISVVRHAVNLDKPPYNRVRLSEAKGVEGLWGTGIDHGMPVAEQKGPKLKNIRYGQLFSEFPRLKKPVPLKKDTAYCVRIESSKSPFDSYDTFIIAGGNKVIVYDPYRDEAFDRAPKSVVIEKNGKKVAIPYSVSFDEAGRKITVSDMR